jgi:hypothetical protein
MGIATGLPVFGTDRIETPVPIVVLVLDEDLPADTGR